MYSVCNAEATKQLFDTVYEGCELILGTPFYQNIQEHSVA